MDRCEDGGRVISSQCPFATVLASSLTKSRSQWRRLLGSFFRRTKLPAHLGPRSQQYPSSLSHQLLRKPDSRCFARWERVSLLSGTCKDGSPVRCLGLLPCDCVLGAFSRETMWRLIQRSRVLAGGRRASREACEAWISSVLREVQGDSPNRLQIRSTRSLFSTVSIRVASQLRRAVVLRLHRCELVRFLSGF